MAMQDLSPFFPLLTRRSSIFGGRCDWLVSCYGCSTEQALSVIEMVSKGETSSHTHPPHAYHGYCHSAMLPSMLPLVSQMSTMEIGGSVTCTPYSPGSTVQENALCCAGTAPGSKRLRLFPTASNRVSEVRMFGRPRSSRVSTGGAVPGIASLKSSSSELPA